MTSSCHRAAGAAPRAKSGVALLGALSLIVLTGIMVAGAFASSLMLARSGRLAQGDAELSFAADHALTTIVVDAARYHLADLSLGASVLIPVSPPARSGVTAAVSATRLRSGVIWLVASAANGGAAAPIERTHRRVNLIARFDAPALHADGALVSAGDVEIGPGVRFEHEIETERDCAVDSAPDVVLAPGARALATPGGSIDGLRIDTRPSAADSTRPLLRASTWAFLAAREGVTFAPGDLTLSGAPASHVILVNGRLTIDGPVSFSGLIVARRGIVARGGGTLLRGVALSMDTEAGAVTLAGTTLSFAPCVALRALDAVVPIRPVRVRSWAELF